MKLSDDLATRAATGCELLTDLSEDATQWDLIRDPAHVVMRYAPAIRRYFRVLIRNADDAEEAAQEFFLRIIRIGFPRARRERGRFRDYLMKAVRNAALNALRDHRRPSSVLSRLLCDPAAVDSQPIEDPEWLAEWRRCLLKRAFRALANHERRSPGNRCHTVMCAIVKYPRADCRTLAAYVSGQTGQPLNTVAFRKQLSRARRLMAQFLVQEVARTLDHPTREQVIEELIELGFWSLVRPYLPDDET